MEFDAVLDYVRRCVQAYGERSLTDVEEAILRLSWEGASYEDMTRRMAAWNMVYAKGTIQKQIGYNLWRFLSEVWPEEGKVTKPKFREIVERRYQQQQRLQRSSPPVAVQNLPAIDPSGVAQGPVRSQLLNKLRAPTSPLVVLTGPSGIGKSHLLQTLQPDLNRLFQRIIHHSVYDPLTWNTWHQQLGGHPSTSDPNSANLTTAQIRHQVIQNLNQHACLIILDPGERLLDEPEHYTFIQEVITVMGTRSRLLWVTSVQPTLDQHIPMEMITGLSFTDTKTLLGDHYPHLSPSLSQQETAWQYLNTLCGGNPGLLHKSVAALNALYASQLEQFITDLLPLPSSLSDYFDHIWGRLSAAEQFLGYWLAFCPLSRPKIKTWPLILPFDQTELMQAWEGLHRRHFLEFYSEPEVLCQLNTGYFRLYLLQMLQTHFVQELIDETLHLFHRYPVYIPHIPVNQQEDLQQYLLQPVAHALQKKYTPDALGDKFKRLLNQLTTFPQQPHSCAAGNLFNLATQLTLTLPAHSWTGLTLWYADLSRPQTPPYDFQGCQLIDSTLMTGLQGATVSALNPQGTIIAMGDAQGWLQIYQHHDHQFRLQSCRDLGVPITNLKVTPDHQLVVTLLDQTIHIWNTLALGDDSHENISSDAAICSMSVRRDGQLLAAGVSSGQVYLWNLMWGESDGTPLPEMTDIIGDLAFSPNGEFLAAHDSSNRMWIWHRDPISDDYIAQKAPLPLDPYGHFLACTWGNTELQVVEAVSNHSCDIPQARIVLRSFTLTEERSADDSIAPHIQELDGACQPHKAIFSENGAYFVLCDREQHVRLWHRWLPVVEKTLVLPTLPYGLAISNDGQRLLCQNADGISLWDLDHGECLRGWETVSDLDQYAGSKFRLNQGLSDNEILSAQRLGGIIS